MSAPRFPDWPERLADFFESRADMPFAWGSNDCGLFYADAHLAMTGVDMAAKWRGYKTAKGASSRIKKAGGMRALALQAGLREKARGFVKRGDCVLGLVEGRETFGVADGQGNYRGPGEDSMVHRPMTEAIAVFEA